MNDEQEADYSQMTDSEFDKYFEEIVGNLSTSELLAIGDVASILREELNNEVLDAWADDHPALAYHEEEEDQLTGCECDNTHKDNDTVCRWCWAKGRRHWNDPDIMEDE